MMKITTTGTLLMPFKGGKAGEAAPQALQAQTDDCVFGAADKDFRLLYGVDPRQL